MRYVVAVLVLAACGSREPEAENRKPGAEPETEVVLLNPLGSHVLLATTAQVLAASHDSLDDDKAFSALCDTGQLWSVPTGTVAIALERKGEMLRVRCLSREGWTWEEFVRK